MLIEWEQVVEISLYELQWRVVMAGIHGTAPATTAPAWTTSDAARRLSGQCCVKAGLDAGRAYEFRVAPSAAVQSSEPFVFSEPSEAIVVPLGNSAACNVGAPGAPASDTAMISMLELQHTNAELQRGLDEERQTSQRLRGANAELKDQVLRLVALLAHGSV